MQGSVQKFDGVEKSEVAESDFYTDFLINSTDFSVNSADFSKIRPSRSRRILAIFEKSGRIFKP
jgi:hypothetical protein